MKIEPLENLDELIAEEKRLVAEEHLLEAWEAGLEDGIECEILAASFASRVFSQLSLARGDMATTRLLEELMDKDRNGDFSPNKILQ